MGKKKNKKKSKAGLHSVPTNVDDTTTQVEGEGENSLNGAGKAKKAQYTVDQLMAKVDEYLDEFNYELAQRFCQRALDLEPNNVRVLQTSGVVLLETDDLENAKRCFAQAIELSPDSSYSQYMYQGQLLTGKEAIASFTKGIELMKKQLESQQATVGDEEVTVQDISNAYCSIAEIYLTDECMSEEAEEACRACLESATEADPSNPEAFQLLASFWLSKDDKKKAGEMIEKGVVLWLPKMEEVEKSTEAEVDPVYTCSVSYPARVNAAKVLIEVENYDTASQVLELLLDEEDEVVEVWYLLGWLNYLQKGDFLNNARFYLTKAKEVATKTKFDDVTMLAHMGEILDELGPEAAEPAEGDESTGSESPDSGDDDMDVEDCPAGGAVQSMEH